MEELLTVKETAAFLKVSEICVQRWLKAGTIPGKKFGNVWRVRMSDLMKTYEEEKQDE